MDEEKRIVETTYSESPIGLPNFMLEVLAPVGIFAVAFYALAYVTRRDLALFIGALAAILSLLWRLYQWDAAGRPVSVREHKTYTVAEDEPQAPRERWAPVVVRRAPNHTEWRVSKMLDFSPSEWRRLARALSGDRLTRRPLESLQLDDGERMFANITVVYPEIVEEMQRIGWVDEDRNITDVCRQWFHERNISLESPLPTDAPRGTVPEVQTNDHGRTGANGGVYVPFPGDDSP